ncbi:MAG: DMT family transporter [Candidatus Peregrinibacteria bacterium]|nr:DMT family transporter [Candidatus Peregrinibacteria bacterium]
MKTLSRERQGEILIFFEILIWSFFPIVSKLAFLEIEPIFTVAISSLLAGVFFSLVLTFRKQWHQFVNIPWKETLLAIFLIGVCLYFFLFLGMKMTTAGNTAMFGQFEILFSFLLLSVFIKHEKWYWPHVLGAILMLLGALVVLFPGEFRVNYGDLLVIFSMGFAPLGNFYAQKVLKKISSVYFMMMRSFLAGGVLFCLAGLFEVWPTIDNLEGSFVFLILNGVVIFGLSKVLWLESISRMPITKATSLNSFGVLITLVFAYFILNEVPTVWQVCGVVPILGGVVLLLKEDETV